MVHQRSRGTVQQVDVVDAEHQHPAARERVDDLADGLEEQDPVAWLDVGALEDLGERLERHGTVPGCHGQSQHLHATASGPAQQLVGQAGLADPGVPADHH